MKNLNERTKYRIALVDNAKGLLVLFFLFTHLFAEPPILYTPPGWLKHHGDVTPFAFWRFLNISLMDLGPIFFFFFIGLTLFDSFSKRVKTEGKRAAYRKYLFRNAVIFSITFADIFIKGQLPQGMLMRWSALAGIAFTGFLLTPFLAGFIRNNAWVRFVLGAAVLAAYQCFQGYLKFLDSNDGGMMACVGYVGTVLIASVIGDLSKKGFAPYALASVGLFFAAWTAKTRLGEPSYVLFNASYMIMSLFAVNLFYFVIYVIDKLLVKGRALPVFAPLGRNIIVFLFLTLSIEGLLRVLSAAPYTLKQMWIIECACVSAYVLISLILGKKNIVIKL
ncbi:MAG: hypothetical protein LBP79_03660 [Clostridiales bacterium]|jgi:hypothetical protein|nr:hypothetical protein [Clostridiales bacterium]